MQQGAKVYFFWGCVFCSKRPSATIILPKAVITLGKNLFLYCVAYSILFHSRAWASWYRKFLADFATIAEPLTFLTKKDRRYEGTFEKVRALIATASVLARPSFNALFVVLTGVSDTGIGAVFLEVIGRQERELEFVSRTLSSAERNYSVTERECLAVVWAIGKFRPYIEGYHFLVVTDHSSLRWLHSLHCPTVSLARWALELQGHSFDVEHQKGALNHVPDALSRM